MFFKKKKFWISDNDKEWVQDQFRWLIKVYGYPTGQSKIILFSREFFPNTLLHKEINIDALIVDFSGLVKIDRNKVSFQVEEDIRDTTDTPYEIQGRIENTELIIERSGKDNLYRISIAKTLFKHPGQLLFELDIIFIKIRLLESKIDFEMDDDWDLLIYLAGIFFGHGVILFRSLNEWGTSSDNFWKTNWKFVSLIPEPVMAYALALYCNLFDDNTPSWKSNLGIDRQRLFENAVEFIKKDSNPLFNKQELESEILFKEAVKKSKQNDEDGAIETFQKILFLTKDKYLISHANNGIGYAYLKDGEYEKNIPFFQKAIEIKPGYGYANDNLGFAFIMIGELDNGKYYLSLAMQTRNNDVGYSSRNFALYHQARKEYELAEEYFQKAFNSIKIPVDFLEYFYAQFLFEKGNKEKGKKFLQKAVEKGEKLAIKLMNSLNKSQ